MIIDFKPKNTFLSTGEKHGFYTLRIGGVFTAVTFEGETYYYNGSEYCQNLSTEKEKAVQRGAEISDAMGLPFYADATFDLVEIQRISNEEATARREAEERFQAEREKAKQAEYDCIINEGVMTGGKYTGCTIEQIAATPEGQDYLRWLARPINSDTNAFTKWDAMVQMALVWVKANPIKVSEWQGTVGNKHTFTAILTKKIWTNGRFPSCMFRFVDEDGNIFVTYSTSKGMTAINVWETATIEATVKEHENSYYEDDANNKVTMLNRPKVK